MFAGGVSYVTHIVIENGINQLSWNDSEEDICKLSSTLDQIEKTKEFNAHPTVLQAIENIPKFVWRKEWENEIYNKMLQILADSMFQAIIDGFQPRIPSITWMSIRWNDSQAWRVLEKLRPSSFGSFINHFLDQRISIIEKIMKCFLEGDESYRSVVQILPFCGPLTELMSNIIQDCEKEVYANSLLIYLTKRGATLSGFDDQRFYPYQVFKKGDAKGFVEEVKSAFIDTVETEKIALLTDVASNISEVEALCAREELESELIPQFENISFEGNVDKRRKFLQFVNQVSNEAFLSLQENTSSYFLPQMFCSCDWESMYWIIQVLRKDEIYRKEIVSFVHYTLPVEGGDYGFLLPCLEYCLMGERPKHFEQQCLQVIISYIEDTKSTCDYKSAKILDNIQLTQEELQNLHSVAIKAMIFNLNTFSSCLLVHPRLTALPLGKDWIKMLQFCTIVDVGCTYNTNFMLYSFRHAIDLDYIFKQRNFIDKFKVLSPNQLASIIYEAQLLGKLERIMALVKENLLDKKALEGITSSQEFVIQPSIKVILEHDDLTLVKSLIMRIDKIGDYIEYLSQITEVLKHWLQNGLTGQTLAICATIMEKFPIETKELVPIWSQRVIISGSLAETSVICRHLNKIWDPKFLKISAKCLTLIEQGVRNSEIIELAAKVWMDG